VKDVKILLKHILRECEFLTQESQKVSFEEFVSNPVLTRAFVRSLEVIGEAVKKLPLEFKEEHFNIPWKEIAGMRDKLIHDYFGVDYEIVWKTIEEGIPELRLQVIEILNR
jgi:uncharacterized protein with HEPN domain